MMNLRRQVRGLPLNNLNNEIEPVEALMGERPNPVQKTFPPSSESYIYIPLLSLMTKNKREVAKKVT